MGPAVHSVVARPPWSTRFEEEEEDGKAASATNGGGNSLCRFNPIIDIRKGIIILARDWSLESIKVGLFHRVSSGA